MPESPLPPAGQEERAEIGRTLLAIARGAIVAAFGRVAQTIPNLPRLAAPGACFVSLHAGKSLRGCVGSLEPRRSLAEDVSANARAAAFQDLRFPPVEPDELTGLTVEVSLLSPLESLPVASAEEACARLRPFLDGVVLEFGAYRATFLPQVWEQLPKAGDFLRELRRKAGLPRDFWDQDIRLYRYTVERWSE